MKMWIALHLAGMFSIFIQTYLICLQYIYLPFIMYAILLCLLDSFISSSLRCPYICYYFCAFVKNVRWNTICWTLPIFEWQASKQTNSGHPIFSIDPSLPHSPGCHGVCPDRLLQGGLLPPYRWPAPGPRPAAPRLLHLRSDGQWSLLLSLSTGRFLLLLYVCMRLLVRSHRNTFLSSLADSGSIRHRLAADWLGLLVGCLTGSLSGLLVSWLPVWCVKSSRLSAKDTQGWTHVATVDFDRCLTNKMLKKSIQIRFAVLRRKIYKIYTTRTFA